MIYLRLRVIFGKLNERRAKRFRSQVAKATDCNSVIVGSTPTGTSILSGIVAELVDATDLKSVEHCAREGSSPSVPTITINILKAVHVCVWTAFKLFSDMKACSENNIRKKKTGKESSGMLPCFASPVCWICCKYSAADPFFYSVLFRFF